MKRNKKGLSILSIATMTTLASIVTLTMSTTVFATTGDIINTGNKKIYSLTSSKSIQALIADLKDGGSDVFLKEDTDGTYYDPSARLKAQQAEVGKMLKAAGVILIRDAVKAYIQANAQPVMDNVAAAIATVPKQTVDITTYTNVDSVISITDNTDITSKFTDANFKTEIYTLIGKTSPAPILYSDVKNIKELKLNFKNISSLSGIEYFTALTYLSCYRNQLTSIDLTKNTSLTSLNCGTNQLTTLDVSKSTALTSLYCDFNQIAVLDVSKNTLLTHLWCDFNQIAVLDLTKNTTLIYLGCTNNKLTTLDLSKNTALTSFQHDNSVTIIK